MTYLHRCRPSVIASALDKNEGQNSGLRGGNGVCTVSQFHFLGVVSISPHRLKADHRRERVRQIKPRNNDRQLLALSDIQPRWLRITQHQAMSTTGLDRPVRLRGKQIFFLVVIVGLSARRQSQQANKDRR